MKTRSGFVSNSSSSSFVCNVCGEESSGWDLSLSESGMSQCRNGHIFCDDHRLGEVEELTTDQKRQELISHWKNHKPDNYWTPDIIAEELSSIEQYDENEVDDNYEELVADAGINPKYCPICQFKSVYNPDMLKYTLSLLNLTPEGILNSASQKFDGNYSEFKQFLDAK